MKHKRHQRAFAIRHIRRRHRNGVWQPLRIDHNVALDTRNLFTRIVSFVFRAVCIFDTLCVNDAKRRFLFVSKADAGRANLTPEKILYLVSDLRRLPLARSLA